MLDFIISNDGTVCFVLDGNMQTVNPSHPMYTEITSLLEQSESQLREDLNKMINVQEAIRHLTQGKVTVDLEKESVQYDGVNFPDVGLCERILRLMQEGHGYKPFVSYLENLGSNPSLRAIMEMFPFTEHQGFPITEDGCVLAYKAVDSDYKDKWSRKIDNSVGSIVEVPRDAVCDDKDQACAPGLHCGSLSYINWYGNQGTDKFIIVKVNPRDVVSVPAAESADKMRVCRYEVVKDMDANIEMQGELYTADGNRVESKKFTDLNAQAWFDQSTNDHWEVAAGANYDREDDEHGDGWHEEEAGLYDDDDELEKSVMYDEDELERCGVCDYPIDNCICSDNCPECGNPEDNCECCSECGFAPDCCTCDIDDDDGWG